jgi:glycine dehydrogenase
MLATIGASSIGTTRRADRAGDDSAGRATGARRAAPESEALAALRAIASRNRVQHSLIGMGYADTLTPAVVLRNVLENPGWYTAYTPYQAEIAQGRLEALLNYQQMVIDLTGLELANASLLDEATAAAEAMSMARRVSKSKSNLFFVDAACFPQTIDVLKTRAAFFGFELVFGAAGRSGAGGGLRRALPVPGRCTAKSADLSGPIAAVKSRGGVVAVASDLMALVLLRSPGEMGADIALGSAQRFGVPLGFGGPHAAFFATRDEYKRAVAGRIIGVSVDAAASGRCAWRCRPANSTSGAKRPTRTSAPRRSARQHGRHVRRLSRPAGPAQHRRRIHRLAALLAEGLRQAGIESDQALLRHPARRPRQPRAERLPGRRRRRLQPAPGRPALGIAINEKTSRADIGTLIKLITGVDADLEASTSRLPADPSLPALLRRDAILTHPVFNTHHTEHQMLRYLKKLQNRDLALDHSMISLGSCTMKLNASSEMIPITWPEFADIHPFAPLDQAQGYLQMIGDLEAWLKAITGFDAICMQPNSGAQGEYAGLVAIARYHASRGESQRKVCLIPKSAHGTNPATAQMCGMRVVVVDCDDCRQHRPVADLAAKAAQHAANLACLMITYPSTHGVFEEAVRISAPSCTSMAARSTWTAPTSTRRSD